MSNRYVLKAFIIYFSIVSISVAIWGYSYIHESNKIYNNVEINSGILKNKFKNDYFDQIYVAIRQVKNLIDSNIEENIKQNILSDIQSFYSYSLITLFNHNNSEHEVIFADKSFEIISHISDFVKKDIYGPKIYSISENIKILAIPLFSKNNNYTLLSVLDLNKIINKINAESIGDLKVLINNSKQKNSLYLNENINLDLPWETVSLTITPNKKFLERSSYIEYDLVFLFFISIATIMFMYFYLKKLRYVSFKMDIVIIGIIIILLFSMISIFVINYAIIKNNEPLIFNFLNPSLDEIYYLLPSVLILFAFSSYMQLLVNKLRFLAAHDKITGLLNRDSFRNIVKQSLNSTKDKNFYLHILILKPKGLQEINEITNFELGDNFITKIADCIKKASGAINVGRIDEDKFAFLLKDFNRSKVISFIDNLKQHVCKPIKILNIPFHVEINVGVSKFPNSLTVDSLFQNALQALSRAEKIGKDVCFQDENVERVSKLKLLGDIEEAINRDQFVIFLQPKIKLPDKKICGAEALIRWNHLDEGMISPEKYIDSIEASNLIHQFTPYVIKKSLKIMKEILAIKRNFNLSINLSAKNVMNEDFLEVLINIIKESKVPVELLTFEITESVLLTNSSYVIKFVNEVHKVGCKISIDDFGKDYSSLSYLAKLHVDEIKIDKSLIDNILVNNRVQIIFKHLIELSKKLDIKVCAEGIDDKKVVDFIIDSGCDLAQGFYFSQPIFYQDLRKYL